MVMMEPIEFGARQRKSRCDSTEMVCSSPVSTSYGGSPPLLRDSVGTPSLRDHRAELERKWKSDKHGQPKRRASVSPGSRVSFQKAEPHDFSLSGNIKVDERSSSSKQGRKQQKVRQSLASKVCLNPKSVESLTDVNEVIVDEDQDDSLNSKTFERLVQLSELEEEVFLLHKRLAEELELRAVLESALEHASGPLTNFPRHLPISAQELLANITLLEVAVLKLEEQSSILQSEVGQARTEREIAELRVYSAESAHFRLEGSNLHLTSTGSDRTRRDDHTIKLPGIEFDSDSQRLKSNATPISIETTPRQICVSLGSSTLEQESELGQPQSDSKGQRALTLRQDLRLTIPEFPENDYESVLPWHLHHEYDSIRDSQSQGFKPVWKQNPVEEEQHWIPLNEHHSQAMFVEAYCVSPQDCNTDPCLEIVSYGEHDEDLPCFSPAIIAETLRPQTPALAELAEDDDGSSLPVAEVLWKPSTVNPSALSKNLEDEIPTVPVLAIKPESWSFTSEDDHPRPESGSVPHSMIFEDQPSAQLIEAPSVVEFQIFNISLTQQRTKYRIGVMNVREQRRQGISDMNCERLKSLASSQTSSISSAKSGALLSPIWSPVDVGAEEEDGYESQESVGTENNYDLVSSFKSPNQLSEEMVRCMISIYRHLADSNNTTRDSLPLDSVQSPTSPFAATKSLSASSLSESSLLSFTRSPLVDLRSKEVLGNDASPDPYKSRGKIPWADIGPYAHVLELSWLTVGKDQLEFAADALRSFKILVEHLSKVDPSNLKHEEKLAFWINIYNALLMHAYLAYGIPRSDIKFFSLLQKAAYTVGGHSFNAATMEFCLLKSKSTAHRPQLSLLMSLHKNKLTEDQTKFGINHPESLVSFGLCSGTRSSPMMSLSELGETLSFCVKVFSIYMLSFLSMWLKVRVYTSKHVKSQLEDALRDYTRAAVGISTKGRLLVPKLLYTYAREFVEDGGLLDWICNRLPSDQVAVVFECIQQRRHRILGTRNFNVLSNDFTFRYLFPVEVFSKMVF